MGWIKAMKLKCNLDKTEVLLVGSDVTPRQTVFCLFFQAKNVFPLKKQVFSLRVLLGPVLLSHLLQRQPFIRLACQLCPLLDTSDLTLSSSPHWIAVMSVTGSYFEVYLDTSLDLDCIH